MRIPKALKKIFITSVLLVSIFSFSLPSVNAEENEIITSPDTSTENLNPTVEGTTNPTTPNIGLESGVGGYVDGWEIVSKTYTGETYGSWNDCVSTLSAGRIYCSKSVAVSNSYSGTLKVSKSSVDSTVGFNISTTWTTTASYSQNVNARQKIQYRMVYDNYTVKQNLIRTYLITGVKSVIDTAYVYPKKYSHIEYRIVSY